MSPNVEPPSNMWRLSRSISKHQQSISRHIANGRITQEAFTVRERPEGRTACPLAKEPVIEGSPRVRQGKSDFDLFNAGSADLTLTQ